MPTETTANRAYQLPHPDNELDTDVVRLISALQAIDADVASLLVSVSQAALAGHGHIISDVSGLQAALDAKAGTGHTHAIDDLSDVNIAGAPAGRPLTTQPGGGVGIGPDWAGAIAALQAAQIGQISVDGTGRLIFAMPDASQVIFSNKNTGAAPCIALLGGANDGDRNSVELRHGGVLRSVLFSDYDLASDTTVTYLRAIQEGDDIRLATMKDGVTQWDQLLIHSATGNVGVGKTPDPMHKLDVDGVVNADNFTIGGKPLPTGAPAGTVMPFASATPPTGWLACNGAGVSRATYADLFAVIGTTFGAGDGSTTFNLPDLRGEFVRGWDGGRGVDAGRTFGSAQADAFQDHKHMTVMASNKNAVDRPAVFGGADTSLPSLPYGAGAGTYYGTNTTLVADTDHQTGTYADETRPRNVAMLYCIKAFDVVIDPAQVSAGNVIADVASNTSRITDLAAEMVVNAPEKKAVGAVGTYAMLLLYPAGLTNPGDTRPGADLRYANAYQYAGGTGYSPHTPAGTWRCMGNTEYVGGNASSGAGTRITLWLRIA